MPSIDLTKYTQPYLFDVGGIPAGGDSRSAARLGRAVDRAIATGRQVDRVDRTRFRPQVRRRKEGAKPKVVEPKKEKPLYSAPGQAIRDADDLLEIYGYREPVEPKPPTPKQIEDLSATGPYLEMDDALEAVAAARKDLQRQYEDRRESYQQWQSRRRTVAETMWEQKRRLTPAEIESVMKTGKLPVVEADEEDELPTLRTKQKPAAAKQKPAQAEAAMPGGDKLAPAPPRPQQAPAGKEEPRQTDPLLPLTTREEDKGDWFLDLLGLEPQVVYTQEEIDAMWAQHKSATQRRMATPPPEPFAESDSAEVEMALRIDMTDEEAARLQEYRQKQNQAMLDAWARNVWARIGKAESELRKDAKEVERWQQKMYKARTSGETDEWEQWYADKEKKSLKALYDKTGVTAKYEARLGSMTLPIEGVSIFDPVFTQEPERPVGLRGEEGPVDPEKVLGEIMLVRPDMPRQEKEALRSEIQEIVRQRTKFLDEKLQRQEAEDSVWNKGFDIPTDDQAEAMRQSFSDPVDRFYFDMALRNAHYGRPLELFNIMEQYFPEALGRESQ